MRTINYTIRSLDTNRGSIIVEAEGFGSFNIDLPIDEQGNLPTGNALDACIKGYLPYTELERQEIISTIGIVNAASITPLVVPPPPPPEPTLAELKEQRKTGINNERDYRETQGFTYNGKVFDSDQRSTDRIQVAAIAAQAALGGGQPFSVDWTTADNSVMTLDAVGMVSLAAAFAQYAAGLHETAKILKAQVDAAQDKAAVEAIVWP